MDMKHYFQLVTALVFTVSSLYASSVPLLIWSNDKSQGVHSTEPVLGKTLTSKEVTTKYVTPLLEDKSQGVLLFIFDKLSMDDFTKYSSDAYKAKSSIFEHLKEDFSKYQGTLVPSVEMINVKNMIASIKSQKLDSAVEIFSSDLDNWKKSMKSVPDKATSVIVHLFTTTNTNEEVKRKTLSENDDIVSQIITDFSQSFKHYTVLVTAEEPSEVTFLSSSDAFAGRHLLQTKVEKYTGKFYNKSGCVYLYMHGMALGIRNVSADFGNSTFTFSDQCKKNETGFTLKGRLNLPDGVSAFTLSAQFELLASKDWNCTKMEVRYSGTLNGSKETDQKLSFDCSGLHAPSGYSYACGSTVVKDEQTKMFLSFKRFQLQPFGIKDAKFGNAYDCVGFFSIPIFMGLFVAFVLITILLVGILSMMSIQTMDRFDDPKGPTIQVPHE